MSKSDISERISIALPSIWRFAYALSGSATLADDLAQSTCLRALEKAHQFRQGGSFSGWCLSICRSIWLNDLRANAVRRAGGLVPVEEEDIEALLPSAELQVYAREVIALVATLPEAQRAVVMLVYVEEFTYSEAAHILDIPIGTVMSRLSAARGKLRAHLQQSPEDGSLGRL